jgi:hypothetical protein
MKHELCAILGRYSSSSDHLPNFYGQRIGPIQTLEDGTDTLPQNFGKELQLDAA